jgi:hypothetical protein
VWPGNDEAARGIVTTVVAVAEYELANGRAQAAVSLLGELTEPHPLLERARAEAVKEAERVAELEHIGRQYDHAIGTRTRALLALVFGIAFTVIPVVVAATPEIRNASHARHVAWAVGALLAVALASLWARESVAATAINRRLAATMLFLFVMQAAIAVGGWIAGRPVTDLYQWNLLLYGVIAGMMTIAVDLYLWPATLAYIAAFLIASNDDSLTLYLTAACNGLITTISTWRWKPASIRSTEEERAERKLRLERARARAEKLRAQEREKG